MLSGALEGMDSTEQSEVLKSLGPKASATFNQIQQYKELNKKLSQSRNPSDWDKAAQISGSIQQLYDKFGKEMKGESLTPTQLPSQQKLTPQQLANIDKQIKQLEKDNEQIKADANRRNWELVANLGMDALTAATL